MELLLILWLLLASGVLGLLTSCCCGCTIIADTDLLADWTQRSGTWSFSGGTLVTTSVNALIVRSEDVATDALDEGIVITVFIFNSAYLRDRVIACWLDDDNYLAVEFIADGFPSLNALIRLVSVSGGVATQLGDTIVVVNVGSWNMHTLQVCYKTPTADPADYNFKATWTWGSTGGFGGGMVPAGTANNYAHATGPGQKMGLGSLTDFVAYDQFLVSHALTAEEIRATCPTCLTTQPCLGCCQYGTLPKEFILVLTWFTDGTCACSALNGTYYLTRSANCALGYRTSIFCSGQEYILSFSIYLTSPSPGVCRWTFIVMWEEPLPWPAISPSGVLTESYVDFVKPFKCDDPVTFPGGGASSGGMFGGSFPCGFPAGPYTLTPVVDE